MEAGLMIKETEEREEEEKDQKIHLHALYTDVIKPTAVITSTTDD